MPSFLSDPPSAVYLSLFALVVVTGAVAFRYQNRKSVMALVAASALLILVALIDFFFQSPRERSVLRVQGIKQAMNDRQPDALLANVSDSFDYQGKKKADLRNSPLWEVLKNLEARVEVWDFNRDDVKQIDDRTIQIGFMAKGESRSDGQLMMYIQATCVLDPDGQYRVRSLKALNPLNRAEEIPIPF